MSSQTLLYIILSGIAALFIALFQYLYKSNKTKLNISFTFLRFLSVFSILLLIINPKFEKNTLYTEKPRLAVAVDNSQSITHLNQTENANTALSLIRNNELLNKKYTIDYYSFGNAIQNLDSLNFEENRTDLASVFNNFNQVYKNNTAPTLVITDGNQTYGRDYEFVAKKYKQDVYPIILGDTIVYSDLKLQQLNVNKYVFLKNKFSVEMVALYSGNSTVNSKLQITSGNSVVYSQPIEFSKEKNSFKVTALLDANKVGVHVYKASIVPIAIEKNKINNHKQFAIEVIDEKTNIALISDILHPDLGAIKKAIESNQQRTVSILNPNEYLNSNDEYQLAIVYQPNSKFQSVFERLEQIGLNKLVISGPHTQWSFLNKIQSYYSQENTQQTEEYQPSLNSGYNTFNIEDFSFNNYPPLTSEFGEIKFSIPYQTLLYKTVNSIETEDPMLVTFEDNQKREALLLGENIWKWRAQNFLIDNSFENFDNFIGKLVQYLASNKRKSRFVIDYESFYQGNENINIRAQYFDKNYEFDKNAKVNITIINSDTEERFSLPLIQNNANYAVSLKDLLPGNYKFTVSANSGEFKRSGEFTLLEYNIEKQFLNASVTKLQEVATNGLGESYFYYETDDLINNLINSDKYTAIQKSTKKIVPLIDFKYLLFFIVLCLSIEWFLRKYNGLI